MYDTVTQYGEVLSNEVDDWHPPVMVRLWQLLLPLGARTGPMFVLQAGLYAFGFALIVAALAKSGRPFAALAAAVLAVSPLLLGWQMIVLKDAQMLGALLAAIGIVAHYRLGDRKVPATAVTAVAILTSYATLVRANALFATVPLVVMLLPRPVSTVRRATCAILGILVLLAAEPVINHRLFGASSSGVANSQPLFDLAAVAVATPASVPPFTPAERWGLLEKHCVKAFFWDPVTEPSACGPTTERVDALPERDLYVDLAQAIVSHPVAYALHRLAHWNSTERWLVPPGLIDAAPPDEAEPNDEGLTTPANPLVPWWQARAGWEASTPLGWPIVWTALSLLLLPAAWRRRAQPEGGIALALLVSAASLEASFLVISIASDLRYHLWSMTSVPLGLVFLSNDIRWTRREWAGAAAVLGLIIAGGTISRSALPVAPDSYQGMLHAPSG